MSTFPRVERVEGRAFVIVRTAEGHVGRGAIDRLQAVNDAPDDKCVLIFDRANIAAAHPGDLVWSTIIAAVPQGRDGGDTGQQRLDEGPRT